MPRFLISGYNKGPKDCGIRAYNFDVDSQNLEVIGEVVGMASPSYCQKTDSNLYIACETPDHGGMAYCELNIDGVPQLVNQVTFPDAAGTTFTLLHPTGKHLYGADYNSGSISCSKVSDEGELCKPVNIFQHTGHGFPRPNGYVNFDRQLKPHVHTLSMVPETSLMAAVDLGLDIIVLYETNEEGAIIDAAEPTMLCAWPDNLSPDIDSYALKEAVPDAYSAAEESTIEEISDTCNSNNNINAGVTALKTRLTRKLPKAKSECVAELPVRPAAIIEAPPCAGPRIVTYHPSKPLACVICELSCEAIIFNISDNGKHWEAVSRIDLLRDVKDPLAGNEAPRGAQCLFSNDGRFMYAATRGVDIVTTFAIDEDCKVIDRSNCSSGGKTPRLIAMSSDERLIAVTNKDSNSVQMFERDLQTGVLSKSINIDFETPSCVVWE